MHHLPRPLASALHLRSWNTILLLNSKCLKWNNCLGNQHFLTRFLDHKLDFFFCSNFRSMRNIFLLRIQVQRLWFPLHHHLLLLSDDTGCLKRHFSDDYAPIIGSKCFGVNSTLSGFMFIHIITMFKFIMFQKNYRITQTLLSFLSELRAEMAWGWSKVIPWWTNTLVLKVLYYLAPSGAFDFVSHPSPQQSMTLYPLHLPCCFCHWILVHVSSLWVMPFLPILSTFWNNTHSQGLHQFTKSWLLLAFFSSCVRKASLLFRHAIRCV